MLLKVYPFQLYLSSDYTTIGLTFLEIFKTSPQGIKKETNESSVEQLNIE